nr:MAG TPA: hypothetical protein [Caudoviricetes sp.]
MDTECLCSLSLVLILLSWTYSYKRKAAFCRLPLSEFKVAETASRMFVAV